MPKKKVNKQEKMIESLKELMGIMEEMQPMINMKMISLLIDDVKRLSIAVWILFIGLVVALGSIFLILYGNPALV